MAPKFFIKSTITSKEQSTTATDLIYATFFDSDGDGKFITSYGDTVAESSFQMLVKVVQ